jgi:hypothetical protein
MAEGEGVLVRKERNEENNKKKEIYMKKGSDIDVSVIKIQI